MKGRTKVMLSSGLVVLVALGAGAWWWLSRDSPDAVSLDAATEQVSTTTTSRGNESPASSAPGGDGVSGTWKVDNETGDFDFESATGSFAGFRITEELVQIGTNEAVGRTGDVTGSITIAGNSLEKAELEVQMTTLTSNESIRDGRVQEALDTAAFPTATFSLTEPVRFDADAASGDPVDVKAVGDLTVHGVKRQVTATVQAKLVNETVVVVGSIPVTFSDFGVEVPSAPRVLSVADTGTVEFQLLFTRS